MINIEQKGSRTTMRKDELLQTFQNRMKLKEYNDSEFTPLTDYQMDIVLSALRDLVPESREWISVKTAMPEEHDSLFAKFYNTPNWRPAMFKTTSHDVEVTVLYEDGRRIVTEGCTIDGEWNIDKHPGVRNRQVIAWRPFDTPYEGD